MALPHQAQTTDAAKSQQNQRSQQELLIAEQWHQIPIDDRSRFDFLVNDRDVFRLQPFDRTGDKLFHVVIAQWRRISAILDKYRGGRNRRCLLRIGLVSGMTTST